MRNNFSAFIFYIPVLASGILSMNTDLDTLRLNRHSRMMQNATLSWLALLAICKRLQKMIAAAEPDRFNLTNTIISTINRVGCYGIQSEIVVLDGALCIPDGT